MRFGSKRTEIFSKRMEKFEIRRGAAEKTVRFAFFCALWVKAHFAQGGAGPGRPGRAAPRVISIFPCALENFPCALKAKSQITPLRRVMFAINTTTTSRRVCFNPKRTEKPCALGFSVRFGLKHTLRCVIWVKS